MEMGGEYPTPGISLSSVASAAVAAGAPSSLMLSLHMALYNYFFLKKEERGSAHIQALNPRAVKIVVFYILPIRTMFLPLSPAKWELPRDQASLSGGS